MRYKVVLNGEYYAGSNAQGDKLVFDTDKSKAVVVDERRLRCIRQTVFGWSMSGERELNRLEILKVKEVVKPCSVNAVNVKPEPASARIV